MKSLQTKEAGKKNVKLTKIIVLFGQKLYLLLDYVMKFIQNIKADSLSGWTFSFFLNHDLFFSNPLNLNLNRQRTSPLNCDINSKLVILKKKTVSS